MVTALDAVGPKPTNCGDIGHKIMAWSLDSRDHTISQHVSACQVAAYCFYCSLFVYGSCYSQVFHLPIGQEVLLTFNPTLLEVYVWDSKDPSSGFV